MNNYEMFLNNSAVYNTVDVRTKDIFNEGEQLMLSFNTVNKLFHAAFRLRQGQFLGITISWDKDGHGIISAYSGTKDGAAVKDFEWIFADYANVAEASENQEKPQTPMNKDNTYYLCSEEQRDDTVFAISSDIPEYFTDFRRKSVLQFFDELKQAEGSLQIKLGINSAGKLSGIAAVNTPKEISLRMRAATDLAFNTFNTGGEPKERGDSKASYPLGDFRASFVFLLTVFVKLNISSSVFQSIPQGYTGVPDPEIDDDEFFDNGDDYFDDEFTDEDQYEDAFEAPREFEASDDFREDLEDVFEDEDEDDEEEENIGEESKSSADTPIEDLELSVRAYNCLKRAAINTVGDILAKSDEELRNVRNLGKKNYDEVQEAIKSFRNSLMSEQAAKPNYTDKLNNLIGLNEVKEQVKKITAYAKMKQDLKARGGKEAGVVLNMEFSGNPGTAKTTVARILAGIFYEIGLLSSDEIVEVGRQDLIEKFVGHTAKKVKEVFDGAKGKLLFIDEAYSLIDDREGSFGDEAINTIVQEMENRRGDTIVIFAGYPDKMKEFFARNPGFQSRVPFHLNFADYSTEEMFEITKSEAAKKGFEIQAEAVEKVKSICEKAVGCPDMGNGRFCRNLVESAILNYSLRVYGDNSAKANTDFVLSNDDFDRPQYLQDQKKPEPIGFKI